MTWPWAPRTQRSCRTWSAPPAAAGKTPPGSPTPQGRGSAPRSHRARPLEAQPVPRTAAPGGAVPAVSPGRSPRGGPVGGVPPGLPAPQPRNATVDKPGGVSHRCFVCRPRCWRVAVPPRPGVPLQAAQHAPRPGPLAGRRLGAWGCRRPPLGEHSLSAALPPSRRCAFACRAGGGPSPQSRGCWGSPPNRGADVAFAFTANTQEGALTDVHVGAALGRQWEP